MELLLSWLLLYSYPLIFAVFFLSALVVPLPGNTLLVASGAFASQGYMNFWLAACAAFLGNVAGDTTGYFLSHWYGDRLLKRLKFNRRYLATVEAYVRHHPRKTIVVSRFAGSLDPAVNMLSGLTELPWSTFTPYMILGNAIAIMAVITTGFALGESWQQFSDIVSIVGWIVFGVVALGGLVLIFQKQLGIAKLPVPPFLRKFLEYRE